MSRPLTPFTPISPEARLRDVERTLRDAQGLAAGRAPGSPDFRLAAAQAIRAAEEAEALRTHLRAIDARASALAAEAGKIVALNEGRAA